MCNKIEELEKKIAYLEKMNDLLRTLAKKRGTRIQELREDYDELNDISIELTEENNELKKANDILTEECNKALTLNDKHGGEAKDLKEENESLKKQLANALDLYDERGEIVEKHEELKASLKTILNFIYGVDTDGDKIRHLEENESLRQANIELVNHFGGDTDCIIRSIMVNGGKI